MSQILIDTLIADGAGNQQHTLYNPTVPVNFSGNYWLTALQFNLRNYVPTAAIRTDFQVDIGTSELFLKFFGFWGKSLSFMPVVAGAQTPVNKTYGLKFPNVLFLPRPREGVSISAIQLRTTVTNITSIVYEVLIYGMFTQNSELP